MSKTSSNNLNYKELKLEKSIHCSENDILCNA